MIRDPGSSARPAAALRVAPAVSRADRHAARRFRERVRDRAGWRLDDYGITLLAWDDGEVVGCIGVSRARDGRFLMEDRGIRLPGWLPRRTTGEVSRWAALPRHGLSVQVRLAEAAARWMHDEGMTHAIGLMTPEGRRRLERTPLRIAPLGPPRSILSGGRREPLHPVWAPIPDPARGAAPAGPGWPTPGISSTSLEVVPRACLPGRVSATMTIGEVSERSGVATSALRFYEERGLLAAERTAAGHRRYPRAVLRRVAFIVFAQRVGLTLGEIREELARLPADRVPRRAEWSRLTGPWRERIDRRIAELERLRGSLDECIGCGCLSLDRCRLANPGDRAGAAGPGPRFWMGDPRGA